MTQHVYLALQLQVGFYKLTVYLTKIVIRNDLALHFQHLTSNGICLGKPHAALIIVETEQKNKAYHL